MKQFIMCTLGVYIELDINPTKVPKIEKLENLMNNMGFSAHIIRMNT